MFKLLIFINNPSNGSDKSHYGNYTYIIIWFGWLVWLATFYSVIIIDIIMIRIRARNPEQPVNRPLEFTLSPHTGLGFGFLSFMV